MHTFDSLRRDYPVFAYDGYRIEREPDGIRLGFGTALIPRRRARSSSRSD